MPRLCGQKGGLQKLRQNKRYPAGRPDCRDDKWATMRPLKCTARSIGGKTAEAGIFLAGRERRQQSRQDKRMPNQTNSQHRPIWHPVGTAAG